MNLRGIEGHPGLWRNIDTGQIFSETGFGKPLDKLFPFDRWNLKGTVSPLTGEAWWIKRWSVVMHPWPELIPDTLSVKLMLNALIVADVPLFSVAEPLAQERDKEILDRLEAVERCLKIDPPPPRTSGALAEGHTLSQQRVLLCTVYGDADDYTLLREKTKVFSLRLQGGYRYSVPGVPAVRGETVR